MKQNNTQDGLNVMELLDRAGKAMISGQFTKRDLEYIEKFLVRLLESTKKVLKRTDDENRR